MCLRDRYNVSFIEGDYDTKEFYDIAKGYDQCREGGERCFRCYALRLRKTCETEMCIRDRLVVSALVDRCMDLLFLIRMMRL